MAPPAAEAATVPRALRGRSGGDALRPATGDESVTKAHLS